MSRTEDVLCTFMVVVIVFGVGYIMWDGAQIVYCPIYKATLPFGIIQVEGSFVIGSGSISGEEMYYVKYWANDGTLRSLSIEADRCPIVVDGTFRLEMNKGGSVFRLHIPKMPEANQTWTTEWIK